MDILNSKITKVAVYNDRAQITRVAHLSSQKGQMIVRFDNLPENIEENSIQVSGAGQVILKEIKYKNIYFEETQSEQKQKLIKQAQVLKEKITEIADNISHAKKEKEFMENIVKKVTGVTEKASSELNPEKWVEMISLYRAKLDSNDSEIRTSEKALKETNAKHQKLLNELEEMTHHSGKTKKVVDVTIDSEQETNISLALTYIVYGPAWRPTYNVRVSSESKEVTVEYYASITQQTDEDWNDISLSISTAQVQIAGNTPTLLPWYIKKYIPAPPRTVSRNISAKKSKRMMKANIESADEEFGAIPEAEQMAAPEVAVEKRGTSTGYTISGKSVIPSNTDTHKLSIGTVKLTADFEYSIVPDKSSYAYLTAKVINKSEFTFLQGKINIFFENNFVAESTIKTILPEEEFKLSLGVDESIKTKHKVIPSYNKDEGLFNKKHLISYEYETKITNTKSTDENITLLQRIPKSNNEAINIDMKTPKIKENTEAAKIDNQGILIRKFMIPPKEEVSKLLKFTVEHPRDMIITGL